MTEKVLASVTAPDGKIVEIFEDGPVDDLFADGIANIMTTTTITKITFVATQPNEDMSKKERRRVAFRVVLPARAFAEFCFTSVAGLRESRDMLLQAFDGDKSAMQKLLEPEK